LQIIGITGHAGHGKDTVADMIADVWTAKHGPTVHKMAFADALKAEAATAFGVSTHMFCDREAKDTPQPTLTLAKCTDQDFVKICLGDKFELLMNEPLTPRFVAQYWGTQYKRAENPTYWVAALLAQMIKQTKHDDLVVISDVRFANEAAFIRQFHGEIWRVVRPRAEPILHVNGHISERGQSAIEPDRMLINSTLNTLRQAVTLLALPIVNRRFSLASNPSHKSSNA
jgi:hypothetical protein